MSIFIPNKYTRWYYSIIAAAKSRSSVSGYIESHHIIPKSLGGSNDPTNLVKLTAREHFVCHLLLIRMTNNYEKTKMIYAASFLAGKFSYDKRTKVLSRTYENLKLQLSNTKRGKKLSEETKQKMRAAWVSRKEKGVSEETRQKISAAGKGRKQSPEEIQKRANSLRGRKMSAETKALLSAINKSNPNRYWLGKARSEETKRKCSEAQLGEKGNFYGRKHTDETKAKIRARRVPPSTE